MTVYVNFKVDPENKNLNVSIDTSDYDPEFDSQIEIQYAKKILATAVQLNFVELPKSTSFDVGGRISISQVTDEQDDDYDYDLDNGDELIELDDDELDDDEFPEENYDEVIVNSESIEIDLENTAEKEPIKLDDEPNESWSYSDEMVEISLDLKDANDIIGGLTTPSAVATMMVYNLFKRVVYNVEKSTNRAD